MLLTIAGILSSAAVFNAVYPAITRSSGALTSASSRVDERLKSGISIIHTVGEMDANGSFSDTNGNGKFDVFIWIKNTGGTRIDNIDECDVFLGPSGDFVRVPHESDVEAGTYPRWSYSIENNDNAEWAPRATVRMTITYNSPPDQLPERGIYDVKIIIPNGLSDDDFFSM